MTGRYRDNPPNRYRSRGACIRLAGGIFLCIHIVFRRNKTNVKRGVYRKNVKYENAQYKQIKHFHYFQQRCYLRARIILDE